MVKIGNVWITRGGGGRDAIVWKKDVIWKKQGDLEKEANRMRRRWCDMMKLDVM